MVGKPSNRGQGRRLIALAQFRDLFGSRCPADRMDALLIGLCLLALAIRISNAFTYPIGAGFDALGNWAYIEALTRSWALPDPAASWSTGHAPLFYYAAAVLTRIFTDGDPRTAIPVIRLANVALAAWTALLAFRLVSLSAPRDRCQRFLAPLLVLYLPVHIYMSAMLTEEVLVAFLVSASIYHGAVALLPDRTSDEKDRRAVAAGVTGGLALLSKPTGLLPVLAVATAFLVVGIREGNVRGSMKRAATILVLAFATGGWYYAYNFLFYGYFYPYAMPAHRLMFTMPPGDRSWLDYFRLPLATWTDPQLLSPSLLHSIPGSTYVTIWFDGHRHFLPRDAPFLRSLGSSILVLAILPTGAFLTGGARGLMRAIRLPTSCDTPFVFLVGLTAIGYWAFTWKNPWYVTVKGSYLLGLALPFSYYTAAEIARMTTGNVLVRSFVRVCLTALATIVAVVFSSGLFFSKTDPVGLPWQEMRRPASAESSGDSFDARFPPARFIDDTSATSPSARLGYYCGLLLDPCAPGPPSLEINISSVGSTKSASRSDPSTL